MPKRVPAFVRGRWCLKTDVQDFIHHNYRPYEGGPEFLAPATARTRALWRKVTRLMDEERRRGGVLGIDVKKAGGILSHGPGYIDRRRERIVGLQTDLSLIHI